MEGFRDLVVDDDHLSISHEKALTEKGPRKRIMEKASTPP